MICNVNIMICVIAHVNYYAALQRQTKIDFLNIFHFQSVNFSVHVKKITRQKFLLIYLFEFRIWLHRFLFFVSYLEYHVLIILFFDLVIQVKII